MACRARRRLKHLGPYEHRWEGNTIRAMQQERWISLEEYLELDRTSLDVKYEYVDGRIYAMAGGSTSDTPHGLKPSGF